MWEYEMTYFIKKTWSEYDVWVCCYGYGSIHSNQRKVKYKYQKGKLKKKKYKYEFDQQHFRIKTAGLQ